MNEDDSAARDVLGNRTAEDPGAAFAGGDGPGDAPKRLWVERAMPRLLDSEADEYFDFARFAEEQKEVQRKLADGWSMKGSSRYYSNIELMVYYDPKNPRLQHVYDDVDWAHCEGHQKD